MGGKEGCKEGGREVKAEIKRTTNNTQITQ